MSIRIFSVLVATIALVGSAGTQAQESSNKISSPPQFGEYVELTNQVKVWNSWAALYVQLTNAVTYQAPTDGFVVVNSSPHQAYSSNNMIAPTWVSTFEVSLGANTNNLNISFKWDVGQSCSITTIPIPSGYFFRVNGNNVYWLPINNQPSTNSSWIASDNSFFSAISSNLEIPSLQSSIALQGSSLSNSISSLTSEIAPTNTTFVQAIATNPSFVSTLTSNPAIINAIAAQIASNPALADLMPKKSQTLNFPAFKVQKLSTNAVTVPLKATSSGKLTNIVFSSGNDAIASVVSNSLLTINGAGSTTITASSVGSSNFISATASQPLIVNQAIQTLKFSAIPPQTYSTFKTYTLNVTSSANLPVTYTVANTGVAIVSNNVLLLQGTGTTTVTANQAGNEVYKPASATQTLIVK